MHLPFIVHTRASQMYLPITCSYKAQTCVSLYQCWVVLISVQDDGDGCKSTSKNELLQPRRTLANNIPLHAIQSKPIKSFNKPIAIHNMRQTHSIISVYLNSVYYLISYTRLFTKLNLLEILLYVTFLTKKFSRSTVLKASIKVDFSKLESNDICLSHYSMFYSDSNNWCSN